MSGSIKCTGYVQNKYVLAVLQYQRLEATSGRQMVMPAQLSQRHRSNSLG